MISIPVGTCWISRNNLKRYYLKNKRHFVDFLLRFWNVHLIYKIKKKKMSNLSRVISRIINSERGVYLNF